MQWLACNSSELLHLEHGRNDYLQLDEHGSRHCNGLHFEPRNAPRRVIPIVVQLVSTVIGNAVLDIYLHGLAGWPTRSGERGVVENVTYQPGGNGLNVAAALAKLGGNTQTTLLTAIGNDAHGTMLRDQACFAERVNDRVNIVSAPVPPGEHTSFALVRLNAVAGPEFVLYPGATNHLTPAFLLAHLDTLARSRFLHVCGMGSLPKLSFEALAEVLAEARARNPDLIIVGDVNLLADEDATHADIARRARGCLNLIDYFLPNEDEARQYAGERELEAAIRVLNQSVRKATIVKRGAAGVLVCERGAPPVDVPTFSEADLPHEPPVVDTVGAGDVWAATFITALAHQAPLDRACRVANLSAAYAIRAVGATTAIRRYDVLCAGVAGT